MNFAASDLHGYSLNAFLRLLESAGFSSADRLYVIGDVIDRNGDGGIAALRWMARQENVTLIKGNHEVMMLDCGFLFEKDPGEVKLADLNEEQEAALARWHRNGALVTIEHYYRLMKSDPEEAARIMDYIRSAPLYLELAVPMKRFVLVHGGLGGFSPEKGLDEYSIHDLVWTRPGRDERYWEDRMVVLGHTPTLYYGEQDRIFATDTWVDIDTGAAGGGSPMLLRLEDMCPFYAGLTPA